MMGNWVYDGDQTKFPMQVTTIGPDYVYLDFTGREGDVWETFPEYLEGIPLTGALLDAFGFSYKDGLWRHKWGIKVKPEAGFVFIENKDEEHWMYGTATCKDVWFLHQLQNLTKIIVKKDLKIEL